MKCAVQLDGVLTDRVFSYFPATKNDANINVFSKSNLSKTPPPGSARNFQADSPALLGPIHV